MNYIILKFCYSHTENYGSSSKKSCPMLWTYLRPVTSCSLWYASCLPSKGQNLIQCYLQSQCNCHYHLSNLRSHTQKHTKNTPRISWLGVFAKLQKVTISFTMSACPSVPPSAWKNSVLTGQIFKKKLYMSIFRKSVKKIQVSLKSDKNNSTLHEDQRTFFIITRSGLLRVGNVSDKSCRENQNTYFMFLQHFFQKLCHLCDNVEKYYTAGQITDDNMGHPNRMLDTYSYKHTLTICNTYCFSTATMVAQTSLNVTLHVPCLYCIYIQTTRKCTAFLRHTA
jgi:hypothetical protein